MEMWSRTRRWLTSLHENVVNRIVLLKANALWQAGARANTLQFDPICGDHTRAHNEQGGRSVRYPSHILDAMIRRSKSRDYSLLLTVDLHAACRDASGRLHIFWPVLRSAHPRSDLTRWWREKVTRRDSVVADVSRCEIRWISSMVGKKTMAQSIPSRREVGRVMNRQCISCK